MARCREGELNIINKIITILFLSGSIILLPVISFAQGGDLPCGGDDPTGTNPCPLDSWVWLLAIAAGVFGTLYLQHRKKMQKQA